MDPRQKIKLIYSNKNKIKFNFRPNLSQNDFFPDKPVSPDFTLLK